MSRRRAVRVLAGLVAFFLLVPALAIVDYLGGLLGPGALGGVSARDTGAMNASYGVFAAVLVSGAFVAVARAPERSGPAHQQLGLCAVALAAGGLLAGEYVGLGPAGLLLAVLAVLLALNPERPPVFRLCRPLPLVGALAVLGALPWVLYALLAASDGRADRPPEDSYALAASGWHAIVAAALAIPLVAGLASVAGSGSRVSAFTAALAALALAVVWLAHPDAAGAPGRVWGGLAVVWAVALGAAAEAAARRSGLTSERRRG